MDYKLRELKFNDIFAMSRIMKKIGLKDELNKIIKSIDKKDKDIEQLGKELVFKIFAYVGENMDKAQKDINGFMGSMIGVTGKEFGELPLLDSMKIFKQFKDIEGLKDFFTQALQ